MAEGQSKHSPTRVDRATDNAAMNAERAEHASAGNGDSLVEDSLKKFSTYQKTISVDSSEPAGNSRTAPSGPFEMQQDSEGRTNSGHNQVVLEIEERDHRGKRNVEQLHGGILLEELAAGCPDGKILLVQEDESSFDSENSIEGGAQDASELEPTPSVHNLPDRREHSNMREDNFSQEGKKVIKFSSKTKGPLRDGEDRSDHNGGENLDLKMNVQFEESQVPSPMSFNKDENREQKSVTHIFGMQKQKEDGDLSSCSGEREELLKEHRDKYNAYRA